MIVVRFELHSANTGRVTELARMIICNIGGTRNSGDYSVEIMRGRSREALDKRIVHKRAKVLGHPRLSQHVWHLVAKALKASGYDSDKHPRDLGVRQVDAGPQGDGALPDQEPG